MTLTRALALAHAALAHAEQLATQPLAVAVLDAAGLTRCVLSQDGASSLRPSIAEAKAAGCIAIGRGGRAQAGLAKEAPELFAAFRALNGDRMVPAPGGVLLRENGALVGAIGVSGDLPDRDEACALAGVEAAGLTAEV